MQSAVKLGITGFVMYLDEDKVYIEAEGPSDKIEEFKKWCRSGQCSYQVSQISIEKGELRNFATYEIMERKKENKKV
jgi:acylphosphatase